MRTFCALMLLFPAFPLFLAAQDQGPVPGTALDFLCDGIADTVYDGTKWNPPLTARPPVGTCVDTNVDGTYESCLVDQNGNGVIDGLDIDCNGSVDVQISENAGGKPPGGDGTGGGPAIGTRLDLAPAPNATPDGIWDTTYMGNNVWNPPLTGMPYPGTLVDFNNDGNSDARLVDQNNNGVSDGVDEGMDGTVDLQLDEPSQVPGGGGGEGGGAPIGTKLDFGPTPDGVWDSTYLGKNVWNPPLQEMPPVGTVADFDGNGSADAVLVDQDGDAVSDGVDIGMDGSVDVSLR